jgi:hypothetical protein
MPFRILSCWGACLVAAALIAGCGVTAAPVNVEGTVQARVSATVGAATRAQATASRQPGSTVIAIPGLATSTTTSATPLSSTPAATPSALASPAGTSAAPPVSTAIGGAAMSTRVATPLALTTATATYAPAGTPLPAATSSGGPTAPMRFGTYARFSGVSYTVSRYEWGYTCPSGGGQPSTGRKFVTLQVAARNNSGTTLGMPPLQWTFEGEPASAGAQMPCQPDEQAFGNACPRTGTLPPEGRCEGWLLFEVPESLTVPGALTQARALAGSGETASWRLPS